MNEFQFREEFLRFLRDRKEAAKFDWQQALDEFCSKTGVSRLVISPDWIRVMKLREPPQAFQPKISDAASVEQAAYARICKIPGADAMISEYKKIRCEYQNTESLGAIDKHVSRILFSVSYMSSHYSDAAELFEILIQHHPFDFMDGLKAAEAMTRTGMSSRANEVLSLCLEQIEQLDQESQQKYLNQISAIRSLPRKNRL